MNLLLRFLPIKKIVNLGVPFPYYYHHHNYHPFNHVFVFYDGINRSFHEPVKHFENTINENTP